MKKGNISKIVGRAVRGGELCYQVLRGSVSYEQGSPVGAEGIRAGRLSSGEEATQAVSKTFT